MCNTRFPTKQEVKKREVANISHVINRTQSEIFVNVCVLSNNFSIKKLKKKKIKKWVLNGVALDSVMGKRKRDSGAETNLCYWDKEKLYKVMIIEMRDWKKVDFIHLFLAQTRL